MPVGTEFIPEIEPVQANNNALLAIEKFKGQVNEIYRYLPLTTVNASSRNNGVYPLDTYATLKTSTLYKARKSNFQADILLVIG